MSEEILELVRLLVVVAVIPLLAYVQEVGFENLVSKPIFDKIAKLKPFQPYIVTALGIVLAFVSSQLGVDLVPDLAPYLTAGGDVGTVLVGIIISVLSMAFHEKRKLTVG